MGGWLYGAVAGLGGLVMLALALEVYRKREGDVARKAAGRLFGVSILYLFLLFAALPVERLVMMMRG